MTEPFALHTTLSQPVVALVDGTRLLYLLAELTANNILPIRRVPVDLTLLVDVSASMWIPALNDAAVEELARRGLLIETEADGVPAYRIVHMPAGLREQSALTCNIDAVRQALQGLMGRLTPDDRVTLVTFAERTAVVVRGVDARSAETLYHEFDRIADRQLGHDTFLAPGLRLAMTEAEGRRNPDRISRIIVLTDGFAADEAEARGVAGELAARGLPLSTAGVGLAFNEGFLIGLAEMSGGNAHLVFQPSEIQSVFGAELETTQRTVLRRMELRLNVADGIQVRRAHRVRPLLAEVPVGSPDPRTITLAMGDLERDQPVSLLLELLLPARPAGRYRIGQLVATGVTLEDPGVRALVRADIMLQIVPPGQPASEPDPKVLQLAQRIQTFRLNTRALDDAARGDRAGATQKLQSVITQLLAEGEHELARLVGGEVANLAEHGQVSAAGAKQLRYATRKLSQRLP